MARKLTLESLFADSLQVTVQCTESKKLQV